MKACLIAPIPELDRWVGSTQIHLLLSRLFQHPEYVSFYKKRRQDGDYLIIDNGAYKTDGGAAVEIECLVDQARRVGADEIVLPDVIHNAHETLRKGEEALEWLMSWYGAKAYREAGSPRLMVVPQGDDLIEWTRCLDILLDEVDRAAAAARLEILAPAIGVSKVYGTAILQRLNLLYRHGISTNHPVHLLGWAGRWGTLQDAEAKHRWIRSVDSARPFNYALEGRALGPNDKEGPEFKHITRKEDYFTTPFPREQGFERLAFENVHAFRKLTNDFPR